MTNPLDKYLKTLQRLGKIERTELRTFLKERSALTNFQKQVSTLLDQFEPADAAGIEDVFIFGAQIADVWPENEMTLVLHKLTPAVCAFFHGFSGLSFTEALDEKAMERLENTRVNPAHVSAGAGVEKTSSKTPKPKRKAPGPFGKTEVQLHRIAA